MGPKRYRDGLDGIETRQPIPAALQVSREFSIDFAFDGRQPQHPPEAEPAIARAGTVVQAQEGEP